MRLADHLRVTRFFKLSAVGLCGKDKAGFRCFSFRIWCLLLSTTIAFTLGILDASAQTEQLYFHHLNTGNGLSQSTCMFVFKDSYGFIWISSLDGVMRYDGQSVHIYRPEPGKARSLFGKNVQSRFFEDEQHNLWFSTYNALMVYRRATDDFEYFFIQKEGKKIPEGTYGVFYYEPGKRLAVTVDDGDLYWVYPDKTNARDHTINQKYAGKVLGERCYVAPGENKSQLNIFYTFDRWLDGRRGFNRYRIVGDNARFVERYFDGKGKLPELQIFAMQADSTGIFWLSTSTGLVRFDINTRDYRFCNNTFDGRIITSTWGLAADGADKLWVSTDLGLALFDKNEEKTKVFFKPIPNTSNGTAGPTSDLYLDPAHVLWCTIDKIGLDYTALDKPKFPVLRVPNEDGDPFAPNSMVEDRQGNVWVGSQTNWLNKYIKTGTQTGTWKVYKNLTWKLQNMPDGRIFVAAKDKDPYVIDPVTDKRYPVKTVTGKTPKFLDVCLAQDNTLWGVPFEEHGGLWKIVRQKDQYLATLAVPSAALDPWLSKVYQDKKGQLFLAHGFNAVSIFRLDGNKPVRLANTNLEGEAQAFYESEQHVWIGGEFGLYRLDKNSFEEKNILSNTTVNGILPDSNGNLWLSTNNGILQFNPDSLKFKTYSLADGLQDFEYRPLAFLRTQTGQLWFGGIKGINVFDPKLIKPVSTKPNMVITRLLINELPDTLHQNVNQIDSLFQPYDQNTLSFEFVALEFSDPDRNVVSYRLFNADSTS